MAWNTEETVKWKGAPNQGACFRVDYACSIDHREDVVRSGADCSVRRSAAARVRCGTDCAFENESDGRSQRRRSCYVHCIDGLCLFSSGDETICLCLRFGL